jgi:hypothetical protein
VRTEAFELPLRIVMLDPPAGVAIAMQRGKADLEPVAHVTADGLVFDFPVTVSGTRPGGGPRLLGPFVQGPPDGRFVYINSGKLAADFASPISRRAKIPLTALDWALIESLARGHRLEARVAGRARDGGPAAASVPLLPPGWRAVAA